MNEYQHARILVVDDDERNVRVLQAMLHAQGHDTHTASSGKEALQLASETQPDLILLDVMMPDMNGFEVVQKLKSSALTQDIPVIMLSALDDRESRLFGLQAGADEFLTKPVDRSELSVRVKNILALKQYRRQMAQKPNPAPGGEG